MLKIKYMLYRESVHAPRSLITLGWSRSRMRLYSVIRSERSEGEEEPGRSILTATLISAEHYYHEVPTMSPCRHLDTALEAPDVEGRGRHDAAKLALAQQLPHLEILAGVLKLLVNLIMVLE